MSSPLPAARLAPGETPALLRGVALPGRSGAWDVSLADGTIAEVSRASAAVTGLLALPAFSELHVHADRAFVRAARPPRSFTEARAFAEHIRDVSSAQDVAKRAERLFRLALTHGSVRVRTHCDHPDAENSRPRQGIVAARGALGGEPEVEVVAFANAGFDPAEPRVRRELAAALADGADLLGAFVAANADPPTSLDGILDLAHASGARVDLHLDEHGDPQASLLEHLADATLARGLEGRVTAGHCCALSRVDDEAARRTVAKVAAAQITVIALGSLNLFLQDRRAGTPRHRGITLVHELLAAGATVRFGSDNVADAFFPYGDADPLETAWVASVGAQIDDEDVLLAGICDGRTRVEPGGPADLVLLEAESLRDAIARRPAGRIVVHAGRVVAA